jgi:hypothetical protein
MKAVECVVVVSQEEVMTGLDDFPLLFVELPFGVSLLEHFILANRWAYIKTMRSFCTAVDVGRKDFRSWCATLTSSVLISL